MSDICAINLCDRPTGIGTHTRVRLNDVHQTVVIVAVCEKHWQAIRAVPYLSEGKTIDQQMHDRLSERIARNAVKGL